MKKNGAFVVVVSWMLIAGCADQPLPQLQKTELEGNWKLVKISCDAQDSTAITDTALAATSGPKSWVNHAGPEGWVVWDVGTCVYKSHMQSVEMASGQMAVRYAAPVCEGSDCSTFPACNATARSATLTYRLTPQSELSVSIPLSEFGGNPPCGAGQTSNEVVFHYERYDSAVPHL